MSTEKSLYGLVTPEENLITQLAGYVRGGRSIQMTTLVGVLQLLEQWSTEITSLNQQLSAKIISEQNIINAFGISGEGAHSKLVIEYVHGLVAEKSRIAAEASMLKEVNADIMRSVYRAKTYIDSGKAVDAERALQCAIGRKSGSTEDTDAAIAEIESVGAEKMFTLAERALRNFCNPAVTELAIEELGSLASNLLDGRKG